MKTFKQFINEDTDKHEVADTGHSDVKEIADKLRSECSIMVEAFKNSKAVLMRGVKEHDTTSLFGHAHIRKDRAPQAMPPKYHHLINKAMKSLKDLNLPTREDSLFTTSRSYIAGDWGSTCVVFVKNGWTGLVFSKVPRDDYAYGLLRGKAREITGDFETESAQVSAMAEFIQSLEPHIFTSANGLEYTLKKRTTDVLIRGEEYYTLNLKNPDAKLVLEELGIQATNLNSKRPY